MKELERCPKCDGPLTKLPVWYYTRFGAVELVGCVQCLKKLLCETETHE